MAADDVLGQAIDGIADGGVVNWRALHGLARSDEERAELKWLQVLGELANVHRSAHDEAAEADPNELTHEIPAGAPVGIENWGQYRLVRRLGEGGFGRVYCAWDPQLERNIAIKILHEHVADDRLKQRLLREGRALAKVQHPNVVQVFGTEAHGSRVGLCMELVSGDTLAGLLKSRGLMSHGEASLVGVDVCRALAAVHAAGYVHRDVKAQNVMRDKTGKIVLMDFGTGQDTTHQRPADLVGTPLYMAPELIAGQPASVRTDIYAVGVLLYHLVSGEYPVEGRTSLDVIDAHKAGRRRPLLERRPDLPMSFVQVVSKALAPDPAERWSSAAAMLEALSGLPATRAEGRSWARTVARLAVAVVAAVASLITIGMVSSRYFNLTLGRDGFVEEGVSEWLYWGAVAMVAPAILVLMVLVGLSMLRVVGRLILRLSPRARAATGALAAAIHRRGLDDVESASAAALVGSVAVIGATAWFLRRDFAALFAITPNIATTPAETLAFLSPTLFDRHSTYRLSFEWACIVVAALWWVPFRLAARRGEQLSAGMLVAAAATLLSGLILLHFPYRLLYQADFDPVEWRGQRCYVLGEQGENDLLFCPGLPPPRNRIVPRADSDRQHVGTRINPFVDASSSPREQP